MLKILRIIHFTAGLIGAVLIVLMAVTGILLNHRSLIGYTSNTSVKLQTFVFAVHSGHIGNMSIVWLTDLGAICMIVLSITGIWMWFRNRKNKKHAKRRMDP